MSRVNEIATECLLMEGTGENREREILFAFAGKIVEEAIARADDVAVSRQMTNGEFRELLKRELRIMVAEAKPKRPPSSPTKMVRPQGRPRRVEVDEDE